MVKWTLEEIAQMVGGKVSERHQKDLSVTGVSFDTRTLKTGDIFVPIVSQRDGHEFASNAFEKGATCSFWSKNPDQAPLGLPLILVEDTFKALRDFAKEYLKQVNPIKVAITGSNGKTTCKDMTAAVLGQKYKTHKTDGNYNNQIGLPITILSMPKETQAIVLEMGMDGKGQIEALSQMVQPDIAAITMIGESHLENLGSRQGIADAKMEITKGLSKQGILVYNGDEPLLQERVNEKAYQLRSFGQSNKNDLYPLSVESHMRHTNFTINEVPEKILTIPTPGAYNVSNALVAIHIGHLLGLGFEDIQEGLKHFQLSKDRLEWVDGISQSVILNDAYNASPSSMKAVLKYFSTIKPEGTGHKIVVLGDIRELGETSANLHRSLKGVIEEGDFSEIILYGPQMNYLYQVLKKSGKTPNLSHFQGNKESIVNYIQRVISKNDLVLVKSSLGTGLLTVVKHLKK